MSHRFPLWAVWGSMAALASGACAEPPRRAGLLLADSVEDPPVLSIGQSSPGRSSRIDAELAVPADLSCLPALSGPAPVVFDVAVFVQDQHFGGALPGWCVTSVSPDATAAPLTCDPLVDVVSNEEGWTPPIEVGPSLVMVLARRPEGSRDEGRDAVYVQPLALGQQFSQLGVPVRTERTLRLHDLTYPRAPASASAASLVSRIFDCAGGRLYGAEVDLVGRSEVALYADGEAVPVPHQAWTNVDGLFGFAPIEIDVPTRVELRIRGRVQLDEEPRTLGCLEVPLWPSTETVLALGLDSTDLRECEDVP